MSDNSISDMLAKAEFDTTISPMVDACRDYLQTIEKERFRLRESEFVRDLLPLISGEEGSSVDLTFWMHNVGSLFKPIDVYADNGTDKLFTVPPLFNRSAVHLRGQTDDLDTISGILATAESKRKLSDNIAAEYMLSQFRERVSDKTDYLSEFEHINTILVRYGKQPLTLKPEASAALPASEGESEKNEHGNGGYNINAFESGGLD